MQPRDAIALLHCEITVCPFEWQAQKDSMPARFGA
jgi:hypothetical protein